MALYPYTILADVPQTPTSLDPGSAVVVPFRVEVGQLLHIDLIQVDPGGQKQDFGTRAWISLQPMGSPDPSLPSFVQTWHPNKIRNTMVICVYDLNSRSPDRVYAVPTLPGDHYLNILNLTNQPNQFWLTIQNETVSLPDDQQGR